MFIFGSFIETLHAIRKILANMENKTTMQMLPTIANDTFSKL